MSAKTKTIAEHIEGILQRGEAVPEGYIFDPRHDPMLYKASAEQADDKQGSQKATKESDGGDK